MKITVSHDPIARTEITREVVSVGVMRTCDNCGGQRRSSTLFRYGVRPDDRLSGRVSEFDGLFCSIECMRLFHGGRT